MPQVRKVLPFRNLEAGNLRSLFSQTVNSRHGAPRRGSPAENSMIVCGPDNWELAIATASYTSPKSSS